MSIEMVERSSHPAGQGCTAILHAVHTWPDESDEEKTQRDASVVQALCTRIAPFDCIECERKEKTKGQ